MAETVKSQIVPGNIVFDYIKDYNQAIYYYNKFNFDKDGKPSASCISSEPLKPLSYSDVVEKLKEIGMDVTLKDDFKATRKAIPIFHEMTREEQEEIIKEDPLYGTIVCRCETITEGEIIDAIKAPAGARDVDGVKRRTRAGMGRCQGGFCGPQIVEMLAKELGIAYEDVTKFGGNSVMNVGITKGGK